MGTVVSRTIGRVVGWVGNAQVVWALLPQGVAAALSGYLGYAQSGFGWAIFMASGTFCFLTAAFVIVRTAYRNNRLEHKLNVTGIDLVQMRISDSPEWLYRPSFRLHNLAPYEIFYKLTLGTYSFDGLRRIPPDETLGVSGLLAPQDVGGIILSGATGPALVPKGRMVIEVHYGRSADALTHTLKTTLYCTSMAAVGEQGGAHTMLRNVEKLEYSTNRPT